MWMCTQIREKLGSDKMMAPAPALVLPCTVSGTMMLAANSEQRTAHPASHRALTAQCQQLAFASAAESVELMSCFLICSQKQQSDLTCVLTGRYMALSASIFFWLS